VNVISPGTIDTGVFTGVPKEVKDEFVSIIPMGRIGQPREIATAAAFSGLGGFQFRRHRAVCRWRNRADITGKDSYATGEVGGIRLRFATRD